MNRKVAACLTGFFVSFFPLFLSNTPADALPASTKVNKIDLKLASLLKEIEKQKQAQWDAPELDTNKLYKANERLENYLAEICSDPAVLTAPLKRAIDAGLNVVTSPDKKLRIYSWDTETGGTMHIFSARAQYATNTVTKGTALPLQKKAKDSDGPGWSYSDIDLVHTTEGKTIYLATGQGVYSTIDRGNCIQAYSIDSGSLRKVPFFQTKTALLDEISCSTSGEPADDSSIDLEVKAQKLLIPLISEEGKPTGKYLVYKFDGKHFVYRTVSASQ